MAGKRTTHQFPRHHYRPHFRRFDHADFRSRRSRLEHAGDWIGRHVSLGVAALTLVLALLVSWRAVGRLLLAAALYATALIWDPVPQTRLWRLRFAIADIAAAGVHHPAGWWLKRRRRRQRKPARGLSGLRVPGIVYMPAEYPGAVPTINSGLVDGIDAGDDTPGSLNVGTHAGHHNKLAQEIVAVATELGVNPSGAYATVAARLAAAQLYLDPEDPTYAGGAVGDPGTDTIDSTAAFVAVLAAVPSTAATIIVRAKTYLIASGGLTCANPVRVLGMGIGQSGTTGSVLRMTATTGTLLSLTGPTSELQDVVLMHPSSGTRTSTLIGCSMTNANFNKVAWSMISGFSTNLKMDTGVYHTVNRLICRDFVLRGIDVRYTGSPDAGDPNITNSTFDRTGGDTTTGGIAVYAQTLGGLRFVNNKINGKPSTGAFDYGLRFTTQTAEISSLVLIANNSIESFITAAIAIDGPGSFSNSVMVNANELNGLGHTSNTAILVNGPSVPSIGIDGNNILDVDVGMDLQSCKHVAIGSGNTAYKMISTGVRIRNLSRDVHIAKFPIDFTATTGKDIVVDDPYYTCIDYSFQVPFRDYNDTSLHDLFEIGTGLTGSGFATCTLDVDLSGTVQGQGTFARRFARALTSNAAGADSNAPTTIGTDFTGIGAALMSFTLTVAGLGGPVKVGITRGASGTSMDGHCYARVRGNGLAYVRKLRRDN